MELNEFLKLVRWRQKQAFREMSSREKDQILADLEMYIYNHKMDQYRRGLRPRPAPLS